MMKMPRLLVVAGLVAGCHFDKLFTGSDPPGGGGPPGSGPIRLVFTGPPSSAMRDSAIKPPVQVTVFDSLGNKLTTFTGDVSIALVKDGSVVGPAQLRGSTQVPVSAGVATFADLSIDQVGNGYTLGASLTSGGDTIESRAFNVTPVPPPPPPPATQLAFTQPPQSTQTGAVMAPVQVTAQDASGATVPTFTGAITITLNPSSVTLSGTKVHDAVNGVATFSGLSISQAGTGYTLTATASGLSEATSNTFNIAAPPPTTGDLTVTTVTTGSDFDPDAYTVAVDGGSGRAIAINQSVTFFGLPAGNRSVELGDVADNCSVSGANPRTVNVPAGNTASTTFNVNCVALPPPNRPPTVNAGADEQVLVALLPYTLVATFSDPDNDGPWNYTIDWGHGSPTSGTATSQGSISASHPYPILGGVYRIRVTVTDSHGAVGSDEKQLTVTL
jgi:hypothetical protein